MGRVPPYSLSELAESLYRMEVIPPYVWRGGRKRYDGLVSVFDFSLEPGYVGVHFLYHGANLRRCSRYICAFLEFPGAGSCFICAFFGAPGVEMLKFDDAFFAFRIGAFCFFFGAMCVCVVFFRFRNATKTA